MTFAHTAEPLSMAMRSGSRAEHEAAEASAFMSELLGGRVDEAGYAAYLGLLRDPYAALEAALRRRRDDPVVAAVYDPALERLTAIERDLAYWRTRAGLPMTPPLTPSEPSPAVAAYVERLELAQTWDGLLVAHHYTRYLGDLAGGQVIGRTLQRHFALSGGDGVAFYDFPGVPRPKPYRDAYRARLDALEFSAIEQQAVVDEVRIAFRLNRALFAELEAVLADVRRSVV